VRKESSIDECVKQGLKEFGVSNDNVACYHVQDNKICRDLSNTQWVVDAIPDNDSFILVQEVSYTFRHCFPQLRSCKKYIPPDGYRPVHICHFHKTTSNAYGVPYIHNFPMQATIGEMKEEILRRLSQNMKELPKIRLAVVVGHKVEYPEDGKSSLWHYATSLSLYQQRRYLRRTCNYYLHPYILESITRVKVFAPRLPKRVSRSWADAAELRECPNGETSLQFTRSYYPCQFTVLICL